MKNLSFLALFAVLMTALSMSCSSSGDDSLPLTCVAEKINLNARMEARGVLDATRSNQLTFQVKGWGWGRQMPEIEFLAEDGSWAEEGDTVVVLSSSQILNDADDALSELESARADLESQEATHSQKVTQLETEIANAEASLATAELQLDRLEFVSEREKKIKKLEIEKSKIQAERKKKELQSLLEVYEEEINQQLLRIKQAKSKYDLALTYLDGLVLTAPYDGFVVVEENRFTDEKFKQGDTPYPRRPIVSIPDMSEMQVNLELSETEVKNLKEGQKVEVTVSSVSDKPVSGTVSHVAGIAKPIRRNSDVKTVEATVVLDSLLDGMVPGLSATCSIKLRDDSLAVVVPVDAVFDQDSMRVVYIRDGDEFYPKQVRLGWRGIDFVSLDEGLEGGEEIALVEPKRSLIKDVKVVVLADKKKNEEKQLEKNAEE